MEKNNEETSAPVPQKWFSSKISAMIFILIGIIILFFGTLNLIAIKGFVKNSQTAYGSLEERQDSKIINFKTNDGLDVEYSSAYVDFFSRKKENISMLYNPKEPENAKVNSFFSLWGITFFSFAAGIIFIILGVIEMIKKERINLYKEQEK